jgi:E3 ubiquitin-protein ligase HERC3
MTLGTMTSLAASVPTLLLGVALAACGSSGSADGPGIDPAADGGGTETPDGGGPPGDGPTKDGGHDGTVPEGGTATVPPGSTVLGAGTWHSCLLRATGLKCWGGNYWGALGIGSLVGHGGLPGELGAALPYVDLGGHKAVSIETGEAITCAILDDGTLSCWGKDDFFGALGSGPYGDLGDKPAEMGAGLKRVLIGLEPGEKVSAVALAYDRWTHACALLSSGRVKCWGNNGSGELGLGDTKDRGRVVAEMGAALPAVDLGTGRKATQIATGGGHNCAILDNAHVKCWGENTFGKLGIGETSTAARGDAAGEMGDALPDVNLGTGRTAKLIAAGWGTTCAVLDDESIKCWGVIGDYGTGTTHSIGYLPGQMGDALVGISFPGRKVLQISQKVNHGCVLLDDASVRCWGENKNGQVGHGDKAYVSLASTLPAIDLGVGRHAIAISAGGGSHTCALLDNGATKCWGGNGDGQLGLGDKVTRGDGPGEMGDALPAVDVGP